MPEKKVKISYFNHNLRCFVQFYKGTVAGAQEFMEQHVHLHRVYQIEVCSDSEKEQAAAAV
ncbi:MAG: hypothetical protein WC455_13135 [Dehalococcoidia bacterium]|jgi:hypothetical protein